MSNKRLWIALGFVALMSWAILSLLHPPRCDGSQRDLAIGKALLVAGCDRR
ncbi:hypothetical protein [Bradyrhizobium jicamae]|uniref:hypothetical protein n=1 Tax=Bradyrhizobium jicamae TaxID=280332 RepID=UPI000A604021|nr:hypothetical protein [Bradyrhizobium jicamae]